MIQTLCTIALAVAALYSGGMWLWLLFITKFNTVGNLEYRSAVELNTFHLGLCFVVSVGFLGVMR